MGARRRGRRAARDRNGTSQCERIDLCDPSKDSEELFRRHYIMRLPERQCGGITCIVRIAFSSAEADTLQTATSTTTKTKIISIATRLLRIAYSPNNKNR